MEQSAMGRRLSQYDVARKQVTQRENAQVQQENEAINRRFAQAGGGPGGAAIKVQQQTSDASAQRRESALQQVDAAERAELERRDEVQAGRAHQTSERLGSQGFAGEQAAMQRRFAAEEAGKGRDWQTGERLGSQTFAGDQARLGREWQTGERKDTQSWQQGNIDRENEIKIWEAEEGREFAAKMAKQAQDIQQSQFGQQLAWDWEKFKHQTWVDQQNLDIANKVLGEKDMLEKFFENFTFGGMKDNPLAAGLFGGLTGIPGLGAASLIGGGGGWRP